MVLVDTPVWSEFFRRKRPQPLIRDGLRKLIERGEAALIGPIRQELLGGVKEPKQFARLRSGLRAFRDEPISTDDYEEAAAMSNHCRTAGIQGSNTDFLICALVVMRSASIFTLDRDFETFARILPIRLFDPTNGVGGPGQGRNSVTVISNTR